MVITNPVDLSHTLRKNHSGMETPRIEVQPVSAPVLRKNHSGMETESRDGNNFAVSSDSCVRTIVVWKLMGCITFVCIKRASCVRTIVVWKRQSCLVLLPMASSVA